MYDGLALREQLGFIPLGRDPESGLWEFAHLMTGEPARRAEDGNLVLTEETGLVLVLLPGGRFWMGAQANDPNGRNYDPQAQGKIYPAGIDDGLLGGGQHSRDRRTAQASGIPVVAQPGKGILHITAQQECLAEVMQLVQHQVCVIALLLEITLQVVEECMFQCHGRLQASR